MENYKKLLEKAQKAYKNCVTGAEKRRLESIFPELKENEDEMIREEIVDYLKDFIPHTDLDLVRKSKVWIDWLEKQKNTSDKGEISDGYHTFNELYYYRMLYNAAFFNLLPKDMVYKSKKHHDGEECFDGGWFIVMANLPTGQISNHYELKNWDLFNIPEKEVADEWDGHTPQEAAERLHKYLLEKQKPVEHFELKAGHWYFCHQAFCCRADDLTVKEGERFMCEEDGVVKGFVIKHPEKYFVEINAPESHDKKQKSADKAESKFKVGDWIINNDKRIAVPIQILKIEKYGYVTSEGYTSFDKVKTDYHLWTIQDVKDGDVLAASDCSIFIFKEIVDYGCKHYIALEKDNETINVNDNLKHFWEAVSGVKPATKEQRDQLFSKMKEAGYEWDAEKKELKKIEQKHAWSEEDERLRYSCIAHIKEELEEIRNDKFGHSEIILDLKESCRERIKWLESLKERFTLNK